METGNRNSVQERIDGPWIRKGLRCHRHRSGRWQNRVIRFGIRTDAEETDRLFADSTFARAGRPAPPLLYIVPNRDLASFILDCFAGTTVSLFVGFAADFARSFVEMKVIEANSGLTKPAVAVL